jgi:hypothetical protein
MAGLRGCLHAPPLLAGPAFPAKLKKQSWEMCGCDVYQKLQATGVVGRPSAGTGSPPRLSFLSLAKTADTVGGGSNAVRGIPGTRKFCSHSIGFLVILLRGDPCERMTLCFDQSRQLYS